MMLDEAGGGFVFSYVKVAFCLMYRQVVNSRQCAISCGSGGVSKAGGIYTSGYIETRTSLR